MFRLLMLLVLTTRAQSVPLNGQGNNDQIAINVQHPGHLPEAIALANQNSSQLSTWNQSHLQNETSTRDQDPGLSGQFFTYGKGILIGLSVGFLCFAPFCCWKLCKKRVARRRMKNFQSRKRRKRTSVRDDKIELCVTDCDDVTKDDVEARGTTRPAPPPAERQIRGVSGAENNQRPSMRPHKGTGSPPRSGSSLKSCATVLENLAYDDLITSLKVEPSSRPRPHAKSEDASSKHAIKRQPEAIYDVGDGSQSALDYVNIGGKHLSRNKSREHAYETILYQENDSKTLERLNPPPSPIQIKRQSKSEDVTIFPFNPDQPNYEDIDAHRVPQANPAIPKIPEPQSKNEPETKAEVKPSPKPIKSTLSSRGSMCINPSLEIEPSPYLQRTWSAPNAATMERQARDSPPVENQQVKSNRGKVRSPKLRLSKNKIKARIAEVIERKEDLIGELSRKTDDKTKRQQGGLRPKDNRFYCEKPRMRRRIKRKVRKKRRVLDERRRIGIQSMRSRDDAAARGRQNGDDDPINQQGRNRWPLPGVSFESSSGSGSDVWRFRSPLLRSEAYRDAAKREATLLEDIWCHLDEIAQRASRIKESYSSRRASDSLSSLSDDVIIRHGADAACHQLSPAQGDTRFAPRDSASSDRGYFTYKCLASSGAMRRVLERQRRHNGHLPRPRPHSCVIMTSSGMSTLTDTGTGAWMSSTATRCSSFSSSRNNSLFDSFGLARRNRFNLNRFVIPKITLTSPNDVITVTEAGTKGEESYLSVLELYLGSVVEVDPIYEQLSDCVTRFAVGDEILEGADQERHHAESTPPTDKVRVKGDKAGYAIITKRPCVQEVTYVDIHVNNRGENNENTDPTKENTKSEENDSERTSDTIRNGSVGSIDDVIVTSACDVTRPKRQMVVERSGKNYVVVTPVLPRMRLTSSEDSVVDVKIRGDVNDCVKHRKDDDASPDDSGFCVFMEMSV